MGLGVPELIVIAVLLYFAQRYFRKRIRKPKQNGAIAAEPQQADVEEPNSSYRVILQPEPRRVTADTEIVRVSPGVRITVKRRRTVEHSVIINWRRGNEIDIGLQHVLRASIHQEIERSMGRSYQETETKEYEVELNGDASDCWKLIWTDVMLTGTSEISPKNPGTVEFEFRERSELDVAPFKERRATGSDLRDQG